MKHKVKIIILSVLGVLLVGSSVHMHTHKKAL